MDDTPWVARGHSRETTFQRDLVDPAQVHDAVRELTAQVLKDVTAEGRSVIELTLKVRYAPFTTKTHARTVPAMRESASPRLRCCVMLSGSKTSSRTRCT